MVSQRILSAIVDKIHKSLKDEDHECYGKSSLRLMLSSEAFQELLVTLTEYDIGNLKVKIRNDDFYRQIERIVSPFHGLHANWNSDIRRLLIRDYYCKLVLFPRAEKHVAFVHKDGDFVVLNEIGIYARTIPDSTGRKQPSTVMDRITGIVGKRFIIGFYGQLCLPSSESRQAVQYLLASIMDSYDAEKVAIVSSGSGIGVGGMANLYARKRGMASIGLIPVSIKHIVDENEFSLLIPEGLDWGDSTFLFGMIPDAVVFAGGGFWSFLEYRSTVEHKKPSFLFEFAGMRYYDEFQNSHNGLRFSEGSIDRLIQQLANASREKESRMT